MKDNEEKRKMLEISLSIGFIMITLAALILRPDWDLFTRGVVFLGGFYLSLIGSLLNLLVVKVNGGKMPIVTENKGVLMNENNDGNLLIKEKEVVLKEDQRKHYYGREENVRLSFLADRFEIGPGKLSVGDMLIYGGLCWFVIQNSLLLILYSIPL